jgi:hypothetical protein
MGGAPSLSAGLGERLGRQAWEDQDNFPISRRRQGLVHVREGFVQWFPAGEEVEQGAGPHRFDDQTVALAVDQGFLAGEFELYGDRCVSIELPR